MDRPTNRRDPGHRGGRRFWGGGRRPDRRPGLRGRGAPAQRADAGRLGASRQRGRRLGDREGIWSYIEVIRGQQVPFPSLADAGYLAAVPLVVAGIAVFPGRHRIASRAAFLLDGAIIAGALLIISWSTVLGMLYRAGSGDILSIVLGLAYPVSDIAIAVTALLLVSRTARSVRLPLLLVAAGLSANLLSDSAFAYLTTAQSYGPAQLIDTG